MSTLDPQLSEGDVDQLLSALEAFNPPALDPIQATDENVVDQTAGQYQDGQSGDDGLEPTGPQTQSATQINSTIQIFASSLLSNVGGAGGADSSAAEAVNQTLQGIWQIQIGCVFDCFLTQQTQQAEQSNTTIYVVPDAPATATSTANTAMGLIWQLQVGCLFLCYDAVEVQTATSSSTTLVVVPVPPTPPAGSGGGSGGTGQQPPAGTSSVSATGVVTTISAPPALSTTSAPSSAPFSASGSPPPRPSTVALQPLGSVAHTELVRASRVAIGVAPHELLSVGAAVAIPSSVEPLSTISRAKKHLAHHEARRLTRNQTSTRAIEARAAASSVPLGIVFVLLLLAVVGLVGSEFRSSSRKQN